METFVAIFAFTASTTAFLIGFMTELRQARQIRRGEPIALVPTLPYAAAAAVFLMLGLFALPIPWWIAPIGFLCGMLVFGALIMRLSENTAAERKK